MRLHLKARHTSATFRRRQEVAVVSLVNDEINELRARFEKLVARNIEAAQSTSTLSFTEKFNTHIHLLASDANYGNVRGQDRPFRSSGRF